MYFEDIKINEFVCFKCLVAPRVKKRLCTASAKIFFNSIHLVLILVTFLEQKNNARCVWMKIT